MKLAERAIDEEIQHLKANDIGEKELEKVKNKTESMIAFEDMSVMNRANSLAFYELLGDADLMNTELGKYQNVSIQDIRKLSGEIFREENSNTLHYYSEN